MVEQHWGAAGEVRILGLVLGIGGYLFVSTVQ
jgi:hypothetical protein